MPHHPILPLNVTFICSLCNVQHCQCPLPFLHELLLQIHLFIYYLYSLENTNAENLHAVVTSLSKGQKREMRTTSNGQKMLSSSSDANVVKIVTVDSLLTHTPQWIAQSMCYEGVVRAEPNYHSKNYKKFTKNLEKNIWAL